MNKYVQDAANYVANDQKIQAIKEIRAGFNLGIKDAKDLVDRAAHRALTLTPEQLSTALAVELVAAGHATYIDASADVESTAPAVAHYITNPQDVVQALANTNNLLNAMLNQMTQMYKQAVENNELIRDWIDSQ